MAGRRPTQGAGRKIAGQDSAQAKPESRKPYGYVLVLRALARAAITVAQKQPAALRVLCVLAEYVSPDGVCRIGQDTIAARLGVSRQAVNKQIRLLEVEGVIRSEGTEGATRRYVVNTEGLDDARAGETSVAARRDRAKRARRGEVLMKDRVGYPAYAAALRDGGSINEAMDAMYDVEDAAGVSYEFAGGFGDTLWYRKVQPN